MSSTRLALTPVFGLVTGAMLSLGAVSMLLTGVHGTPVVQATNPCSASAAAAHAPVRTAAIPLGRSGAGHPVLLDAAVQRLTGTPHAGANASASATSSGSGSSPAPSVPPPPVPNPTPGGGNVTPSSTPDPGPTGNSPAGPTTPPISPGGNKTPSPAPSPTPTPTTPTPSPTPTPTKTPPPPSGTLCLSVQTLGGATSVDPATTVQFAIFVWLTKGSNGSATVSLDAKPNRVSPTFSVCQPTGKSTCSVTGLNSNQRVEMQAQLRASTALAGRYITLTVTAASPQASKSPSATATIRVRTHKHTGSGSGSGSGSGGTNPNAGDGGTLPNTGLPGVGTGQFPGIGDQPGSLGGSFPQVSPSPNAPPTPPKHHQSQIKVADQAAGLPLAVRLIGGQVIGLAILAAAVTIAVARLSLRRQPAKHSDGTGS